jgi:hypothetical protein
MSILIAESVAYPIAVIANAIGKPDEPRQPPKDSTHRFYLCMPSIDTNDVMICQQGAQQLVEGKLQAMQRIPEAIAPYATQAFRLTKVVTVGRGCPEVFDQLALSSKLKKPVALGGALS